MTVDTEEVLDLHEDIVLVERVLSDMGTQKVADSEQLRCLNTVDKVLEVELQMCLHAEA